MSWKEAKIGARAFKPKDSCLTTSSARSRHNSQEIIPPNIKFQNDESKGAYYHFPKPQNYYSQNQFVKSHQSHQEPASSLSFSGFHNQCGAQTNQTDESSFPTQTSQIQYGYEGNLESREDINWRQAHHNGSRSLDHQSFKRVNSLPNNSTSQENSYYNSVYHSKGQYKSNIDKGIDQSFQDKSSHNNRNSNSYSNNSSLSRQKKSSNSTSFLQQPTSQQNTPTTMNIQHFLNSNKPSQVKDLKPKHNKVKLQQQQQQYLPLYQAEENRNEEDSYQKQELIDFVSFRKGQNQMVKDQQDNDEDDENKQPNIDESSICGKNPFVSNCSVPKDLSYSKEGNDLNKSHSHWRWKWQQQQQHSTVCDQSSIINYSTNLNKENSILRTQGDISILKQHNPQDNFILKQKEVQDISIIKPTNVQDTSCFSRDQSMIFFESNPRDVSVILKEPQSFFKGGSSSNNNYNQKLVHTESNEKQNFVPYQSNNYQKEEPPSQTNTNDMNQSKSFNLENLSKDFSVNCSKVDIFGDQSQEKDIKIEQQQKKIKFLEQENSILKEQLQKYEEINQLKFIDFSNKIQSLQSEKVEVQNQMSSKVDSLIEKLNTCKKKYEATKKQLTIFKDKEKKIQEEDQFNKINNNYHTEFQQQKQLLQNIMEELSVKNQDEILNKIKIIQDKEVAKLLDCLRDMITDFAPKGSFEKKPTIKQIWKWLKTVLKEYMNLKQSEQQNKELLQQAFKYVQADQSEDFLQKLVHLVVDNEGYFKIIQQIKQHFHLDSEKWNNIYELECFFEKINSQKNNYNQDKQIITQKLR